MTTSSRDGLALRALRVAEGVSLGQIVKLTDYSKGHVSKVENGLRPASPRLVRVYESLRNRPIMTSAPRAPRPASGGVRIVVESYGGEIRRARNTLGLSQRNLGELAGISHVYISKLENGQASGTAYVARLLDNRLKQEGNLVRLFTAASSRDPERVVVPRAAILSTPALTLAPDDVGAIAAEAAARLEQLRLTQHLAGPAAVVDDTVAILINLHTAASASPARHVRPLYAVAARFAEYLSWLAEESADLAAMHEWLAVAVQLGRECGDTAIEGYAAVRKSAMALRANDPDAAIRHASSALADPTLPPRLRCIALQRESRARARRGDSAGFHRATEAYNLTADALVLPQASEAWQWGPAWNPQLGSSRLSEATGLMELEEYRAAAQVFAAEMPRAFPNGHEAHPTLCHSRVRFAIREATAYAHVHECDRAADVIESILPAVQRESATVRPDLGRLASILSRRRAASLQALTPDVIALARAPRLRPRFKQSEAVNA